MTKFKYITAIFLLYFASSANAALIERLGGLAYYDDVADITWLTDANAGQGSGYDVNGDGRMVWDQAIAWVENLNVVGVTGWRLPESDTCKGYNCTGSEMGNLFYNVLGNVSADNAGPGLRNRGPFMNIGPSLFWTGTEYALDTDSVWYFYMDTGSQSTISKAFEYHTWAVHSGDVALIPIPASLWLFGSGLIALAGLSRRKQLESV